MATFQSQINILSSQIQKLYKNIPESKNNEIIFEYEKLKTTFTKKGEVTEISYLGSKSYDIIIYISKKGNYILKSEDLIEYFGGEYTKEYYFKDKIYKLSSGDYIYMYIYPKGTLSIQYSDEIQKTADFILGYGFCIDNIKAYIFGLFSGEDTSVHIDSYKTFIMPTEFGNIFKYDEVNKCFVINTTGVVIKNLSLGGKICTISNIQIQEVLLENDIVQDKSDISSIYLDEYIVSEGYDDDEGNYHDGETDCRYQSLNPLIQGKRPAKVKLITGNNVDLLNCIPK